MLPILKEFGPEIILVSSGLDCLIFDPLGELEVTQDSLSKMLYNMINTINSKVVVVLEGGYGVPEMSVTVECMMRVLLGEFFPNKASRKMIGLTSKMSEYITQKFIDKAEEVFATWGKYWPVLFDSAQMAFVKKQQSK